MTIDEIIKAKDEALVNVPNQFNAQVIKAQRELLQVVLRLISQLEYEEGVLVVSEANYARIGQIIEQMRLALSHGEYSNAVVSLVEKMNAQAALTNQYFAASFADAFTPKQLYQIALIQSQRNALLSLTTEGIDANFLEPFRNYLTNAISSSTSRQDLEILVRTYIDGNSERLGRLRSYSGQIADDIFSTIDRAYTKVISDDLDIQFFIYSGGVIDDSRPFCVERHNKYYHREEVEGWGKLSDWAGRIPGTNSQSIFIYAGGYRCRHSILPVSISSVPESVLARARRKGLVN